MSQDYNNSMFVEVSNSERLAMMFRALGDPTRMRIFESLRCCDQQIAVEENGECRPSEGSLSVGEVCCQLGGSPSTISHHIRELRLAGLIQTEKRGRTILCSVNHDALELLQEFVRQPNAAN